MMRASIQAALVMLGLIVVASASQAKPEYAMREKKICGYCHVNPNGGGARNPRGVYYAMHNHTFVDYDEDKVMGPDAEKAKRTGPPAFKAAWKLDAPAMTTRIAVADVTEDKVPRLLLLDDH